MGHFALDPQMTEADYEAARKVAKARVLADQERRRSNAAGAHKTPKHPNRSARRTEIVKEQENG